ncbi:MAG: acyltransferase, partial [Candidatus Micrarchaeia archaeon]
LFFTLYGLVKYLPPPIGDYLRYVVLKVFLRKIGRGTIIRDGVTIYFPEKIEIGNNTTINEFCFVDGFGGVKIGNNVRIAHRTSIISEDHSYENPDIPIYLQDKKAAPVIIEDDVWIGCNVTILKGVRIGKGSIIGSGAVVTEDIPDYSVAVGSPARVIKRRR